MACAETSGLIANILSLVDDESAATYTSGKVQNLIFASLSTVNALMGGICLSGNANEGCISPSISGSIYEAVLQLYVAKELTRKSWTSSARQYNITTIKEGDSTVSVNDNTKALADLYKQLNAEFERFYQAAKYTLASESPNSIVGVDSVLGVDGTPYNWSYPFPRYRG